MNRARRGEDLFVDKMDNAKSLNLSVTLMPWEKSKELNSKKMWRGSEMEPTLVDLVQQAKEGNKKALESLVRRIQDRIYGLALRMLGYPADAEDAAQEILVKVVTHQRYHGI
jgi:hypothetical protein